MNQENEWLRFPDGSLRRKTIHRMNRRCIGWNYRGTGSYLITIQLNDRSSRIFGAVDGPPPKMVPSEIARAVLDQVKRISEFTPEIAVLGAQIMPDHLHMVLCVQRCMSKPLGERLRGFKIGCTKAWQACRGMNASAQSRRGCGLFADGFVDTILFDNAAVKNALAYLADNPRRLYEKRANPNLFRVLRDLRVPMTIGGRSGCGKFAAIGNHNLLAMPHLIQVQCSRKDFAYRHDANGMALKSEPPAVCTPAFAEKATDLLSMAAHGAVLVSPCISHGEKEIANRAFKAGYKVIVLQNKGFSKLYKPGGKLFDTCAAGNLLILAPGAWEYLPGNKPITRADACTLNFIGQVICAAGAADVVYRGMQPAAIESAVAAAVLFEVH